MNWMTKLDQMEGARRGVPKPGSTGPVSFAPGMMSIYSRPGFGIPSARALAGLQNNLDRPRPQLAERQSRGATKDWRRAGTEMPKRDVGVDAVTLQKIARALALDRYRG